MKKLTVNGIPKSEKIWVTIIVDEAMYYVTAKESNRDYYFLYKMVDGKAVKLGKDKNPKELEDRFIWKK